MNPRIQSAPATRPVGVWIRVSSEDQAQGDSPMHHEQRAREYLDGQIPLERFGSFNTPLEERLRQLLDELPKLEAELDHIKINDVSADQVLREARALYARWPSMPIEEKRRVVQSIVQSITIGRDEIEIKFSHLPSSEESPNAQKLM